MELFHIITVGISTIIAGRLALKRWFNHLTLYSTLWTISLVLYAMKFIHYYPISSEAWFYIYLSWFMLFLGSFLILVKYSVAGESPAEFEFTKTSKLSLDLDLGLLSKVIIILSLLYLVTIVYQTIAVIRVFGGLGRAIIFANYLYGMRVSGELAGLPYLGSFSFPAALFAGIYTSMRRKVTFTSIFPFILIGLNQIIVMGRLAIVNCGLFFFSALIFTPHKRFITKKTVFAFVLISIIIIGTFIFISSVRKLEIKFKYETENMEMLRSTITFLPSVYFYISAPSVAFSEYLLVGEENVYRGSYTFRWIFNILSRFNFTERLSLFNPFIRTPEGINAATYLRELHADFGPLGILIFPFILGCLITAVYIKAHRHPTILNIVILVHLITIVWQSWSSQIMKHGEWTVSLFISMFIAMKLDSIIQQKPKSIENG
jgi:oligosaccharide repeat unit polymerase